MLITPRMSLPYSELVQYQDLNGTKIDTNRPEVPITKLGGQDWRAHTCTHVHTHNTLKNKLIKMTRQRCVVLPTKMTTFWVVITADSCSQFHFTDTSCSNFN